MKTVAVELYSYFYSKKTGVEQFLVISETAENTLFSTNFLVLILSKISLKIGSFFLFCESLTVVENTHIPAILTIFSMTEKFLICSFTGYVF